MSIKILVFCLFLYGCLVWVGAFYLHSGAEAQNFGLLWTAFGIALVLAFVIFAKLFAWWRARPKRPVASAAPKRTEEPLHEDDQTLLALIAQANLALAKMPPRAGDATKSSLISFPTFLLIGPEGSGKTSTFLHSGVEPELLAGQESASPSRPSTKLCNFWLARDTVFVEFSGRAFSGDLERWRRLLKLFKQDSPGPMWRRLWSHSSAQGVALRGVIAFADVSNLSVGAAADPQRLERNCKEWDARLRAVADVFSASVPVYQIFSRCDGLPFFNEFFRRLPEAETNQILGCTLPVDLKNATRTDGLVEAEAKRLTASFRVLYQALAQRRLRLLSREPERSLRPAIYEFPREFKKIRPALVQFLTEVFRPNALQFGPVLRGYYFSARVHRESGIPLSDASLETSLTELDGSQVFRGDATRLFKQEESVKGASPLSRSLESFRWIFLSDLFHEVILRDRVFHDVPRVDSQVERYRKYVFASVCGLCFLLCLIFIQSWWRNRELLAKVDAAASALTLRRSNPATLANLQTLDALRKEIQDLRKGSTLSMHWGLYSGDRVLDSARRAYFRGFQDLVLERTNARMVETLASAPGKGGAEEPAPIHDILKAHVMISSGRCKAEPLFLSRVLKSETRPQEGSEAGSDWRSLASRQVDFYTSELQFGNPCRITEDSVACSRARQYLLQTGGVEGVYRVILADTEKSVPKPILLQDAAPNYAQVLSGPPAVSPAFSPEGWRIVEKVSKNRAVSALEPCLSDGNTGPTDPRAIQQMFLKDYIGRWRKYIAGFSVARYSSAKDAARKLELLSDHKSPLLALFATTANLTNFPTNSEPNVLEAVPILGGLVKRGEKASNKVQDLRRESSANLSTADITRIFQPVTVVVPPGSETWVAEKNNAYIDALAQLGHSMQEIADGRSADPATIPAAKQNVEKALDAVRQIAKGFKTLQSEGVDADVQKLLEEPIQNAKAFIPGDQSTELVSKVNGEARELCRSTLRDMLQKFPFQNPSSRDVTLAELTAAFAPGTGAIWKFVQKSLPDYVVKDGAVWKAKDPAKGPQPTPELLTFLTRAQTVTDVFFPNGAAQPQLNYVLRPRADSTAKGSILEIEVDGQNHQWDTSLQTQFSWPAPPGKTQGAVGRIRTGTLVFPFASRSGLWGIFKMMDDAEARPLSGKLLEWKSARGSNGNPEPIEPPVRLDIVEFPGGVDVFNKKFFVGVRCPGSALQSAAK